MRYTERQVEAILSYDRTQKGSRSVREIIKDLKEQSTWPYEAETPR